MPQPPHKTYLPWYKSPYPWVITLVVAAIAFWIGWLIPAPIAPPQSLHLSGYQFIDPLLACNVNNSRTFPEDQSLSNDIQSVVNKNIQAGNLSKAGVYFVDLSNGKWADVDPTNQFYPSSLGKIPIMIAYYEMAETNPSVLTQTITYTGGPDLNDTQDIKPAAAIVAGQTYTIEQLIEYMIEDSDNNATQLLYDNVNQTALQNIYNDLGIPVINDVTEADADAVTPQQISLLFRVLYNGTYLSRDYSEQALELMSHSSFTQGIVAGIPSSTVVAHKLGLVGITSGAITTEHELHDCGIVYANDPYVLCVMTRGTAPLPTMENIISQISSVAYQHVEDGQ
jgi:beta-lactamase class A